MKKYARPVSEVMNLGLKGEMLQVAIAGASDNAIQLDSDKKIDGGDAYVKEERGSWDTGGLWD